MRQVAMIGMLGASVWLLSACGSGGKPFADHPRPPSPITITGSISNSRVLVSPAAFGAGPINLEITNAANHSVSLTVQKADGEAVAAVQSLNPETPGVVKFDIAPGRYSVIASDRTIRPARLSVGRERPSAPASVLEP